MTLLAPLFHHLHLRRLRRDIETKLAYRKLVRIARSQAAKQGYSNHIKKLGGRTRQQFGRV